MNELFHKFAHTVAEKAGLSWTFLIAFGIVVGWGIAGPIFNYSEKWQLFINTITTIVTFLMVFLIQNAQNRDSKATQLKLDELLRSSKSRKKIIDAETMTDEELEREKNKIIKHQIIRKKKSIKAGSKSKEKQVK